MCNRLYSQYAMSGTLWRLCVVPFGVLWVVPFECYGWYPLECYERYPLSDIITFLSYLEIFLLNIL